MMTSILIMLCLSLDGCLSFPSTAVSTWWDHFVVVVAVLPEGASTCSVLQVKKLRYRKVL